MRRDVRVLLVGDGELNPGINVKGRSPKFVGIEGVGKSTIVTSLIKEEYVDNVRAP